MKKVLFLVTALEVGGIETYLLRFLEYISKNNTLDKSVLCKSGKSGVLEDKYKRTNTKIILHKLSFFSIKDYILLYFLLKKNRYDTICDFTGDFSGLVLFVAKLAKISRRIAFYRESEYQFIPTKSRLFYAKIMNILVKRNATKILSNSKTALNEFHPLWQQNMELYSIIYNGIPSFVKISELEKYSKKELLGIPQNAFVIGHVGRYTKAKNHKQIIKIAKLILNKHNNVYFLLCGRDVDIYLKEIVIELGLQDRIIMPGSRDDISDILQCMDIFYFPSLNEGQPNALLEAMSVGIPIVASNIKPIKEIFPKSYYKYLVSPNDISQTLSLLEAFIKDDMEYPTKNIKDYVYKNFNIDILFNKFKNELIG